MNDNTKQLVRAIRATLNDIWEYICYLWDEYIVTLICVLIIGTLFFFVVCIIRTELSDNLRSKTEIECSRQKEVVTIKRQTAKKVTEEIRQNAVDNGVAEWVVIDSKGGTEFRWLSPTNSINTSTE